jgi:predicted PurR-regulated permease PerM
MAELIDDERSAATRRASYALFGLAGAGVIALGLGPALLAGLFSFMVLDLSHRALLRANAPPRAAKWAALLLLFLSVAGGVVLLASFIQDTLSAVPQIAVAVVPKIIELSQRYGVGVPFEDVYGLRDELLRSLGRNLGSVTAATGILTAGTMRVAISMAVAALFFMSDGEPDPGPSLYARLWREVSARVRLFMEGFEKVIGAQVVISLINTVLTTVYLVWAGIPHLAFLVPATFILGIIPIVGNVMSNFLIIGTALTLSPRLAVLSLGFLVFIHTLEHFLNSRVVGGRIEAPMWLTLLSIMVGELVLGVPGIVLAPTLVHYAREELRAVGSSETRSR